MNAPHNAQAAPQAPEWVAVLLTDIANHALTTRNLLDESLNCGGSALTEAAAVQLVALMGSLADRGLQQLGAARACGDADEWLMSPRLLDTLVRRQALQPEASRLEGGAA